MKEEMSKIVLCMIMFLSCFILLLHLCTFCVIIMSIGFLAPLFDVAQWKTFIIALRSSSPIISGVTIRKLSTKHVICV